MLLLGNHANSFALSVKVAHSPDSVQSDPCTLVQRLNAASQLRCPCFCKAQFSVATRQHSCAAIRHGACGISHRVERWQAWPGGGSAACSDHPTAQPGAQQHDGVPRRHQIGIRHQARGPICARQHYWTASRRLQGVTPPPNISSSILARPSCSNHARCDLYRVV